MLPETIPKVCLTWVTTPIKTSVGADAYKEGLLQLKFETGLIIKSTCALGRGKLPGPLLFLWGS